MQAHATQLLERYGIKVLLVDARDTSQICSECRRLNAANFALHEHAMRPPSNSKLFSCSHPIHRYLYKKLFRIDADLNAARNIAMSAPLNIAHSPIPIESFG
ncbi:MAG: zinc ribbon domain-containing protein [Promethearchaeota archaeon]